MWRRLHQQFAYVSFCYVATINAGQMELQNFSPYLLCLISLKTISVVALVPRMWLVVCGSQRVWSLRHWLHVAIYTLYISYFNKIRWISCVNTHIKSLKVWLKSILPRLKYSIFSRGLFFIGAPYRIQRTCRWMHARLRNDIGRWCCRLETRYWLTANVQINVIDK